MSHLGLDLSHFLFGFYFLFSTLPREKGLHFLRKKRTLAGWFYRKVGVGLGAWRGRIQVKWGSQMLEESIMQFIKGLHT